MMTGSHDGIERQWMIEECMESRIESSADTPTATLLTLSAPLTIALPSRAGMTVVENATRLGEQ